MAGRALSFLAASLLLLGVLLPTNVVAAPADKDGHVVPTAIHDRARAEGEVRVLVELLLPSGRVAEGAVPNQARSEEHTSELQSPCNLVCRLLLEKKKNRSETNSLKFCKQDWLLS